MAGLTNNPIELLVALNVNDKSSKDNIDKYIKDLRNQLKDLDVLNLTVKNDSSNNKVFADMQKEIETLRSQVKALSKEISSVGDNRSIGNINISDEIKTDLKRSERVIRDFLQNKGLKDFDLSLNAEVNTKTGEQELKRFTATVKNELGEIERLTFKLNREGIFTQVSESLKNVDQSNLQKVNELLNKITQRSIEIGRNGVLPTDSLDAYNTRMNAISNSSSDAYTKINLLEQTLEDLNNEFKRASHDFDMEEAMNKASRSVENLNSKLEKMRNTYKRQFSNLEFSNEADNISNSIRNLPQPNFADTTQIRKYNEEIANVETRITSLNSKVVQSARSSMTLLNSFKTALEKFPIWMASTTIFFGITRTAREFMSIIIDIDSKMTDLAKVMSDDTNFEALFDRATESAERFGQSISQVLDSYTEFARQGYKADELGLLADAGLVASNVGDITAQKASEYMTASLIQWKKDATEAMGIIDSWNEISNNYATTVEKLAAGQSRAGSVAKAMGLEFDQLNAIIGTVTAATKQSGEEVGKLNCPLIQ